MTVTVCSRCHSITPTTTGGRCRSCARHHDRRRQTPTQRRIYNSGLWRRIRALARARDGGCLHCGATTSLHVHHIIAINAGGDPYSLDNLETLCSSCHHAIEGGRVRR